MSRVFSHMRGCNSAILRGFDAHVAFKGPPRTRERLALGWAETRAKLSALWSFSREPRKPPYPDQFATVPRMELAAHGLQAAPIAAPSTLAQTEQTPPFADEWIAEYDRGRDVVDWYGGAK